MTFFIAETLTRFVTDRRSTLGSISRFNEIIPVGAIGPINPLTTTAIQKLLEMIGRVRLCPSYSFATALDSDINQTAGSGGYLGM